MLKKEIILALQALNGFGLSTIKSLSDFATTLNLEDDFDANKLKRANSDDTKYFESYLRKVKGKGIRVYVLEYSKSKTIAETVRKNCRRNGFTYYISRSIDLT